MIFIAFAFCLLLDLYINKDENFGEILKNINKIFKKSQILFLFSHLSFIFLNFCIFYLNIQNFGIIILYIFCFLNIISEILMIKKYQKGELEVEILSMKFPLIYKILLYFIIFIIFYLSLRI